MTAHYTTHADFAIHGTAMRGLILHNGRDFCAYIGVHESSCLAAIEDVRLPCNGGVNFFDYGDGSIRHAGWYWLGWDYGHVNDELDEFDDIADGSEIAPNSTKRWSIQEVFAEVMAAAESATRQIASASVETQQVMAQLVRVASQPE